MMIVVVILFVVVFVDVRRRFVVVIAVLRFVRRRDDDFRSSYLLRMDLPVSRSLPVLELVSIQHQVLRWNRNDESEKTTFDVGTVRRLLGSRLPLDNM
jgi:adenylate kinase family enzyme